MNTDKITAYLKMEVDYYMELARSEKWMHGNGSGMSRFVREARFFNHTLLLVKRGMER